MKIIDWLFGSKCAACGQRSKSNKHQDSTSPVLRLLCDACNEKVQQEQRWREEEQRRNEEDRKRREQEAKEHEEKEKKRKSFLAALTQEEKVAVSNLNPIIYYAIIKEMKGEDAMQVITDDPRLVATLGKLPVSDLETLAEAVQFCRRADALPNPNTAEAANLMLKATELNPYFDIAFMSYGCTIANLGRLREGIMWVEKALAINPKNERARRNIQGMKAGL